MLPTTIGEAPAEPWRLFLCRAATRCSIGRATSIASADSLSATLLWLRTETADLDPADGVPMEMAK